MSAICFAFIFFSWLLVEVATYNWILPLINHDAKFSLFTSLPGMFRLLRSCFFTKKKTKYKKEPCCGLFTYLHFAYYGALSGSLSKASAVNSIRDSSACFNPTGLWVSTFSLFSCRWYASIQITRLVLHSQEPPSPPPCHSGFIKRLQQTCC